MSPPGKQKQKQTLENALCSYKSNLGAEPALVNPGHTWCVHSRSDYVVKKKKNPPTQQDGHTERCSGSLAGHRTLSGPILFLG